MPKKRGKNRDGAAASGERASGKTRKRVEERIVSKRPWPFEMADAAALVWLAGLFVVGLRLTWGTWIDVQIDFGREAYIPWRMAEGDVLYRDLAYFNGPLSPAINAGLFRVGGTNLATLFASNAVILLAAVAGAWFWLRRQFSRGAATLGATTFLLLFAFNQYLFVGNYDWIGPYSHEMTHGLVLAGLSLACLIELSPSRPRLGPALAGLFFGLVALTKIELALATFAGAVVWFALRRIGSRRGDASATLSPFAELLFLAGAAIPPIVAMAIFSRWLGFAEAIEAVAGSWRHALSPALRESRFYRLVMGTQDVGESLFLIGAWTGLYFVFLYVVGMFAKSAGRDDLALAADGPILSPERARVAKWTIIWTIAAVCLICALSGVLAGRVDLFASMRPWPVAIGALFVFAAAGALGLRWPFLSGGRKPLESSSAGSEPNSKREELGGLTPPAQTEREASRLDCAAEAALLAFAGVLLAKTILFVSVSQYGFVLALPATLLILAYAWERWPARLERRGASKFVARSGLLALWAALVLGHLDLSRERLAKKDVVVGEGADRFFADLRGSVVEQLLNDLRPALPGETVAVLPEGVLLNFLARRESGLAYVNFTPFDLAIFGEERVFEDLYDHPPDWIVILDRETAEYGAATFGVDYGVDAKRWIDANYEDVLRRNAREGELTFEGQLLRRRAGS